MSPASSSRRSNISATDDSSYNPSSVEETQTMLAEEVDKLFVSPSGSKISIEKEDDVNKLCCEELSNIIEDCFLEDDEKDSGKPIEEFYKQGVLDNLIPKNKKTQRKYKKYQDDYLDYSKDRIANPAGKVNSQYTLCNYFNDR